MPINPFTNYPLSWRPNKATLKRPIYLSLVDQMKADIKNGKLLPGTKLPPQRELADYLDVGFSTITRAYKLTQKQGITYGRVGQGTFVAGNVNSPLIITREQAAPAVAELGFVASFESTNRLAVKTIQEVANENHLTALLNYDSPTGMSQHKRTATRYLNRVGMTVNAQNTVITSGGENGLVIALLALFKPGDRLAVDAITYSNLINLARMYEITLVPVEGDSSGMSATTLARVCQNQQIKGIYLVPDFNNPTGITISQNRREELARVIQKFKLILIEDDYLSFVNLFRPKPLTKMSTLVPDSSIYIASMSKPLISGLRIAFMRFPDQFKQRIQTAMFTLNVKTSALDAEIVAKLLENGQGLKIMRRKVNLVQQSNKIFDRIFPHQPAGTGFFRQVNLSTDAPGSQVEASLLHNGLHVFHSDRFAVGHNIKQKFLRVALAAIDQPEELQQALSKLRNLLEQKHYLKTN